MASDYLNTISHFNFKLSIFVAILQVLKFEFQKFRILEILNFHPYALNVKQSANSKNTENYRACKQLRCTTQTTTPMHFELLYVL